MQIFSVPSYFSLKAQVLYDFTAEPGNNELTVKEGETVTITNKVRSVYTGSPALQVCVRRGLWCETQMDNKLSQPPRRGVG